MSLYEDWFKFEKFMSRFDAPIDWDRGTMTTIPPKVIGKSCGPIIYKKHIYFHCRSNC